MSISKKMRSLTKAQKKWAFTLLPNFSHQTKKKCECLACGFTEIAAFGICPNCGKTVVALEGKQRSLYVWDSFHILSRKDEFQILRFFVIEKKVKAGMKEDVLLLEVGRYFFKDGKAVYIGKDTKPCGGYTYTISQGWKHKSRFSVKRQIPNTIRYGVAVYPRARITPVLKRNGFNGETYGVCAIDFIEGIYNIREAETLLKIGQIPLFKRVLKDKGISNLHFKAAIIANRHGYVIDDPIMWIDYIKMLQKLGKDIKNPKYICPLNLREAHDAAVSAIKKQTGELKKIQREKDNKEYIKRISKYKDFSEVQGDLNITVLQSVSDFQTEGDELKHCVYTNEYYNKKDSLILSAKIKDQRTETIEINIKEMTIRQIHGYSNEDSQFHTRIVELVEKKVIPKLMKM